MRNDSLTIRRSRSEDASKILKLLEQEYQRPFHQNEWLWRFTQQRACGQGLYWVAEFNGKIVGGRGVIPTPLHFGHKEIIIGHTVDSIVAKEYRRQGIFGSLARHMSAELRSGRMQSMKGLISTPRPQAYWGVLKNGFNDVGTLCTWIRPIHMSRTIFKLILLFAFNKTLNVKLHDTPSDETVQISRFEIGDFQLEIVSNPKLSDLTYLWNSRFSHNYVQVKKDADRLKWRYLSSPKKYQFFIMKNSSDAPVGGIICKRKLIRNLDVYDIIDLAALNKQIYGKLLKMFVRWTKKQQADLIRLVMHNYLPRSLMFSTGFLYISKNVPWMINEWLSPQVTCHDFILDFNNWRIIAGDIESF